VGPPNRPRRQPRYASWQLAFLNAALAGDRRYGSAPGSDSPTSVLAYPNIPNVQFYKLGRHESLNSFVLFPPPSHVRVAPWLTGIHPQRLPSMPVRPFPFYIDARHSSRPMQRTSLISYTFSLAFTCKHLSDLALSLLHAYLPPQLGILRFFRFRLLLYFRQAQVSMAIGSVSFPIASSSPF
jgi:hypothetical protein